MEKLIELLNEYAYGEHKELYYRDAEMVDINSERVISKKFGFIQRLVENEKIDLHGPKYLTAYYSTTDTVIMLLAISSTPIEDLISYLK